MSHLSNTFCSFSCVLEITDPPSTSRRISFDIATCMDCTVYSEDAPILSRQDLILIYVNYFNASNSDFPVGSLVFCQGILTVLESMSNGPVLSVHATSLLRCPGDPAAIDYYEKCLPHNACISFVGKVISANTVDGCRFFSVQVTTFKPGVNNELGYETFHLVCLMAPHIRWRRVRLPSVDSYVQAMGEIVGFANAASSKCVCISLQNLSYIPVVKALAGTNSPSPSTPQSRERRFAEAASLDSSLNASPQSSSAATTSVVSHNKVSSILSGVDTEVDPYHSLDIDNSPLKKKSKVFKGCGKSTSLIA
ncbi:hypothetical protein V8E54_002684 [Elaphomyces granulatus]